MRKFALMLFAAGSCSILLLVGCGDGRGGGRAEAEKKYRFSCESAIDGNNARIYTDGQTGKKYLAVYNCGVVEIEK